MSVVGRRGEDVGRHWQASSTPAGRAFQKTFVLGQAPCPLRPAAGVGSHPSIPSSPSFSHEAFAWRPQHLAPVPSLRRPFCHLRDILPTLECRHQTSTRAYPGLSRAYPIPDTAPTPAPDGRNKAEGEGVARRGPTSPARLNYFGRRVAAISTPAPAPLAIIQRQREGREGKT